MELRKQNLTAQVGITSLLTNYDRMLLLKSLEIKDIQLLFLGAKLEKILAFMVSIFIKNSILILLNISSVKLSILDAYFK